MKNIILIILRLISRVIYRLMPAEFKNNEPPTLIKKRIASQLTEDTFQTFKEDFKKSLLFKNYTQIREYSITTSIANDKSQNYFYLEFGVFKGKSANYFSKFVKKLYAFDSFEGLKEDWRGSIFSKGHFNLNKKIPKLNSNVEPIVGWVEDTLDDFLKKHNPKINFVHIDLDIYSSTKFVLHKIKPYLVKGAIIVFDEFFLFNGWEYGEYKALIEVFEKKEFEYRAFSLGDGRCVIQIN